MFKYMFESAVLLDNMAKIAMLVIGKITLAEPVLYLNELKPTVNDTL